ncbi:MAG: tetratricopeptide repeat protein [Candidatus Peribacteraceae bacterium]|nr:tetratricopeptide repeat protein [Candidatus Peribacteraceae bacterium]MDD5742399.1 tetratricopeptide repeat protein [Candidatus Peribacteraceae bacterium]
MKIPARILFPVTFALLCAAALLAFLWWQLTAASHSALRRTVDPGLQTEHLTGSGGFQTQLAPADSRDLSLLHLREGDLYAVRGEWAEAAASYEQAVALDGGLPALRKLALAELQRRDMGALQETIRKLKAAGARPEDVALIENIVLLRTGELSTARKRLDGAADSPQKHYALALLNIIEGNHTVAQQELSMVTTGWEPALRSNARTLIGAYEEFALFPESSDLHLITLLSRALAQVQECELALPLLAQVTKEKEDYRDAWIVQGYCELTTERPQQALVSLERAYNLNPEKPEIQYFLARAHAALDQHDNAITFLEYALQNGFTPKSEIRRLIASEALKKGDAAQALGQYKAIVEEPDAPFEAFDGAVSTAIALKRNDEAIALATLATQRMPENARSFDLLGWAYVEAGKSEEARTAITKALELDPYLLSAKERLEKLPQ